MQKTPEQEAAFELARENPSDPLPELVATRLRAAGASYAWRLHRYAWRRKAEHAVAIDPATGYSYSQTVQPEQSYIKHLDMPKATRKDRLLCRLVAVPLTMYTIPLSEASSAFIDDIRCGA